MKRKIYFGFFFSVLIVFSGCAAKEKDEFSDRLKAANSISEHRKKNDALSKLAQDAAKSARDDIVVKAINSISEARVKNTAASSAAILLLDAGNHSGAVDVAELITESRIKNDTLSKIAKGE